MLILFYFMSFLSELCNIFIIISFFLTPQFRGLSYNKIETLRGDTITNMQNLRTLVLHNQEPPMSALYYNAFKNINDNLRELWVSSNALLTFPHQVLSNQQYDSLESVWVYSYCNYSWFERDERGYKPKKNKLTN